VVKNGVVAMLFWANDVIFLLFLLGITTNTQKKKTNETRFHNPQASKKDSN